MKKKGFTLIELLAVIVILAIIALIATPIILSMINNARKSAAKSSAYGYIEAIDSNNGFADAEVEGYTKIEDGTYNISEIDVRMKGKAPESGEVTITNGKVTNANICISGYNVTYDGHEAEAGSECESNSPTYTVYSMGDEIKFDPVSATKCTSGSTCYTWNVITTDDTSSKDSITLQMDHNLISLVRWATGDSTSSGPNKILDDLATATANWDSRLLLNYTYDTTDATNNYGVLSCTNGTCKIGNTTIATNLHARIITAEEVAEITKAAGAASGTTAYNWTIASTSSEEYYFSQINYVLGTTTAGTGSKALSWLISQTVLNDESGATANTDGITIYGYWTLTPMSNSAAQAWRVRSQGRIGDGTLQWDGDWCGARPVITISKSLIK